VVNEDMTTANATRKKLKQYFKWELGERAWWPISMHSYYAIIRQGKNGENREYSVTDVD
jgi:hypothetical protein